MASVNRKHGRNTNFCKAYRLADQRGINKARRLIRHLERFPTDEVAQHAFSAIHQSSVKKAHRVLAAARGQAQEQTA